MKFKKPIPFYYKPSEIWLSNLLNELEPRETDNSITYYKDNEWYLEYDKKNEVLWFQYNRIYYVLLTQFHMGYLQQQELVKRLVEEAYNLRVKTTDENYLYIFVR